MDVFIARQPIFNHARQVFGYELLFRSSEKNVFSFENPDWASVKVLDNAFLLFGIDALTGGKRAFVNFTRDTLVKEYALGLPPELLTVEILETIVPDDEVLGKCRALKQRGFTLVLDDFILGEEPNPLTALADIIKIDLQASPPDTWRKIAETFGPRGITLLAEKVETEEQFVHAESLGCTYFQGYFFSQPQMVSTRSIPGFKLNYLLLLKEINAPEADFDAIEQIVKREVSLSFKLLRYINSVAFGFDHRITSLQQALVLLGLKSVRQWASMAVLSDLGQDRPSELVASSVLRARLCESVARECSFKGRAHELFLMGLFSMIDTLLGRPLAELLELVPLADDCRAALLGEENLARALLDAVIAYERGDWHWMSTRARQIGVSEQKLPSLYLDAIRWTNGLAQPAAA